MRIKAVIGASYGDEGKGLATDYLAGPDSLVVRFNGGPQAGHTVQTPDGKRHVFSHIGAGAFKGATTFLSRFFLVNPRLFLREYWDLHEQGTHARVIVSPDAFVTTPFDVMLNHAIEAKHQHGSCGSGINETVVRSTASLDSLLIVDDLWEGKYREKLHYIATEYMPARAKSLGVHLPKHDRDRIIQVCVDEAEAFRSRISLPEYERRMGDLLASEPDQWVLERWRKLGRDLVFEGAQGLCLDEKSPDFPHVTRSRTGITNVLQLLKDAHIDEPVHAFYLTRTYATRHGNGPLPWETPAHPYGWTGPETNVHNRFQGHFRYGVLDAEALGKRVRADADQDSRVAAYLGVTCCDQTGHAAITASSIARLANLPLVFESYGPTRDTIHLTMKDELLHA